MSLETITTPDGVERVLACLVPQTFPAAHPKFADVFASEMLTLDQVRAHLAGKPSMYGRRQKWAGEAYIRDQRNHGSCNGFATAGTLSRARELRGEPYVCLSGADAYSQMNGNRDEGSTLENGLRVCETGVAPESMVPWNQIYERQISAAAKEARKRFRGFKPYAVDEEAELATALVLGRCAVIAVHAGNSYMAEDGDGVAGRDRGPGNHATGVQDIRVQSDGTLNYDEFGSWGLSNHTGGYTWLTWARHLRDTVRYHRFWVLVSTTDDEQDGSTPPKVK